MFMPVGEWLPDQPDYRNPGSDTVHNVYPKTQSSYGPIAGFSPAYTALAARIQGAFAGMDQTSNAVTMFAGTATKMYTLVSASTSFSDVSGATTFTTATDGKWNFTQFGQRVLATNFSDPIQSFTLGTSTTVGNLSAGAPKARYITVAKDFCVVGNTYDATYGYQPQRIWWSAINDCTNWPTAGSSAAAQVQSDYQDIAGEHGVIQGVVGNLGTADIAIFLERAIWRGTYVGSPNVFSFHPAEGVRGTPAPGSIAQLGAMVFYLGEDGFYMFDGSNSVPIGAQKVDKTFYTDVNQQYMYRITSAIDPINKLVFWAYPGSGSTNGNPNKLLIYNWAINRWSDADTSIELIVRSATFGYTLETLGTTGYNMDTLPFSLDSRIWTGGSIVLSAFDSNHAFGYFTGANLAATVETSEVEPGASQDAERLGRRAFIRSARPISDGGTPSVAIGTRNRIMDAFVYGSAVPVNAYGESPQRADGRYIRARITHPAGDSFSHISGVDVTAIPGGSR